MHSSEFEVQGISLLQSEGAGMTPKFQCLTYKGGSLCVYSSYHSVGLKILIHLLVYSLVASKLKIAEPDFVLLWVAAVIEKKPCIDPSSSIQSVFVADEHSVFNGQIRDNKHLPP